MRPEIWRAGWQGANSGLRAWSGADSPPPCRVRRTVRGSVGLGVVAHLSAAEAACELRSLSATVASGRRFGGIATCVRQSSAVRTQLAVAPNFGTVSPTPWAGRAQPSVVSPSASARSGAPRSLRIRSRPPECMSVELIHTSLSSGIHGFDPHRFHISFLQFFVSHDSQATVLFLPPIANQFPRRWRYHLPTTKLVPTPR